MHYWLANPAVYPTAAHASIENSIEIFVSILPCVQSSVRDVYEHLHELCVLFIWTKYTFPCTSACGSVCACAGQDMSSHPPLLPQY